jgi:hypothetical protein
MEAKRRGRSELEFYRSTREKKQNKTNETKNKTKTKINTNPVNIS